MSDRRMVYGLAEELVGLGDPTVCDELGVLLFRTTSEVRPTGAAEVAIVGRAAALVLSVRGYSDAVARAVGAVVCAARVDPAVLSVLDEAIQENADAVLLRAVGFNVPELVAISPTLVARCGRLTIEFAGGVGVGRHGHSELPTFQHPYLDRLPDLLRGAPTEAAAMALAFIQTRRGLSEGNAREALRPVISDAFAFEGGTASIDNSWWLHSAEVELNPVIEQLAHAAFESPAVGSACRTRLPQHFWVTLLNRCSVEPVNGALRFTELLEAVPILSNRATAIAVVGLLDAQQARITPERMRGIGNAADAVEDDAVAAVFAGLLPDGVLTERLRRLRAERPDARRDLAELNQGPEVEVGALGPDEWLRMEGVNPDREENACLRRCFLPLEGFAAEFLNVRPPDDRALAMIPRIRELEVALSGTAADGLIERSAVDALGGAAEAVLRAKGLPVSVCSQLRGAVTRAATHSDPPRVDTRFSGGWGRPAPRIIGAAALMALTLRCGVDEQIRSLIRELATDPAETVAYQVFVRSNVLFDIDRELMWEIIEAWVGRGQGSLAFLVAPLAKVFRFSADRAGRALARLWARVDLEDSADIRCEVAPLVFVLAEQLGVAEARSTLDQILLDASFQPRVLERILADLRLAKVWLSDDGSVRGSALRFLRRAADRAHELMCSQVDTERAAGAELAGGIVAQVSFAIEIHGGTRAVTSGTVSRLFEECVDTLNLVVRSDGDDFRAHMSAGLVCSWMTHAPAAGVLAAYLFAQNSSAVMRSARSDEMASALLGTPIYALSSPESRKAAIELCAILEPQSLEHAQELREFAGRLARRGL